MVVLTATYFQVLHEIPRVMNTVPAFIEECIWHINIFVHYNEITAHYVLFLQFHYGVINKNRIHGGSLTLKSNCERRKCGSYLIVTTHYEEN